jgi:hypothetical protein
MEAMTMGEHKIDRHRITEVVVAELAKVATDKGLILELGWISMLRYVVPKDAPEVQVDEMRKAFFMGAEHLFSSIISILDPGAEPTEKDLDRMTLIYKELEAFRKEVTSHHTAPGRTQ